MFRTDADRLQWLLEAEADFAEFFVHEELSAQAKDEDRPKYVTNYIGSKQKLIEWIWQNVPDDVTSALDAFSGSSVVGYMFKSRGLAVHSCDRLQYCHHIARAIVENDGVTLTDEDIEKLVADNGNAREFVRRHFAGIFFHSGVHKVIDVIRSNIDASGISGFKRDIALFALGKTCLTGKGGFSHFGTTKIYEKTGRNPTEFSSLFVANCKRINALVFKGDRECKAHHGDTRKVIGDLKGDVGYFDPPYATEFSQTNYERAYHFIEGLMTWWDGKEPGDNKTRKYDIPTEVTRTNSSQFFKDFLASAKGWKHWLISYRDHAYPNEAEVKKIVAEMGRSCKLQTKDHQYTMSAKRGDASRAKEYLFICQASDGKAQADLHLVADETDDEAVPEVEDEVLDTEADVGEFLLSLTAAHDPELLDLMAAHAGGGAKQKDEDAVRVTAFLGNKYFILDFLWKQTPKEAKSVLDAFSGGANVGYFYKRKGMRVVSNDKLAYPYHIARALIENSKVTLTNEDIEALFAANPKAGDFCEKEFHGYYFTKQILAFLDLVWANIQNLEGYKRDLALAALGWTVVNKAKFGQFSRSKKGLTGPVKNAGGRQTSLTNIPLADFQHRFRLNLARINNLVYDNGQENKATRLEAVDAVRKTDCDLVYADPPYITQFGNNDYELNLHFVEGLMTMWADKDLRDNARKDYASTTKYTRETIEALIADVVRHAGGKYLLLSYRDKAYPDEKTIKGFFAERFEEAKVTGVDVQYAMITTDPASGGKYARELVFIGRKPKSAKAASADAADYQPERNMHTEPFSVANAIVLQTDAAESTDKRFQFILTHAGMNRNGDFFTPDELQKAAKTAVGRKIDLSHSQDFRDIVGSIVAAKYVDSNGGYVLCDGEIYTGESEPARMAYKLMKREVVRHVSMECDYQEGECSVCAKKVKSKADYCTHLKNYKGREFQGKPCYEILRGVTFTGVGLLDREGADQEAKIRQVAVLDNPLGGMSMDKDKKPVVAADDMMVDPTELSDADKVKLIKKLQGEHERLTKENETLQKKIDDAMAAQQAAARKVKAEKLIANWQDAGREFSDDERTAEMDRLQSLTEEAFAATESVVLTFAAKKKKDPAADDAPVDDPADLQDPKKKGKDKAKANADMSADAGHKKPVPHSDHGTQKTLSDRLSEGFLAAHRARLGSKAEAE